jgi:hypothetical protein
MEALFSGRYVERWRLVNALDRLAIYRDAVCRSLVSLSVDIPDGDRFTAYVRAKPLGVLRMTEVQPKPQIVRRPRPASPGPRGRTTGSPGTGGYPARQPAACSLTPLQAPTAGNTGSGRCRTQDPARSSTVHRPECPRDQAGDQDHRRHVPLREAERTAARARAGLPATASDYRARKVIVRGWLWLPPETDGPGVAGTAFPCSLGRISPATHSSRPGATAYTNWMSATMLS